MAAADAKQANGRSGDAALVALFARFSAERGGTLNRAELGKLFGVLDPSAHSWTDERIDKLFATADTNKDGRIRFSELSAWASKAGAEQRTFRRSIGHPQPLPDATAQAFQLVTEQLLADPSSINCPEAAGLKALFSQWGGCLPELVTVPAAVAAALDVPATTPGNCQTTLGESSSLRRTSSRKNSSGMLVLEEVDEEAAQKAAEAAEAAAAAKAEKAEREAIAARAAQQKEEDELEAAWGDIPEVVLAYAPSPTPAPQS